MCGITGYISQTNSISPADFQSATSLLAHRGSDAEGFYFSEDKSFGLGHRRLSILDLSDAANQPIYSAGGRYVMVFNGEVYNFRELRKQLQKIDFKTTSDSEVILEYFAKFGTASFRDFRGMFALAIYDLHENVLTVARDHAGIKPLFFYSAGDDIIFSSELKVIDRLKSASLSLDKKAIANFLHLGFIPHPFTIYSQIKKFPAGHYLQLKNDTDSLHHAFESAKPFWNAEATHRPAPCNDLPAAKQTFKKLLEKTVAEQLVSDVPVGTFLSGGIDSSLITAVASGVISARINSFSIAIDGGKYNESNYARSVAGTLKTNHHEFSVKEGEVIELIHDLLPAYDEPFADSSAFPTMMVSRLARREATVALSGDGGDELFYGYGAYRWARRMEHPAFRALRQPIHRVGQVLNDKYKRASKVFDYPAASRIRSHIFSQEQYFFSEQEVNSLMVNGPGSFDELNMIPSAGRDLDALEEQALWDFRYYLPDDLLIKVDRASMKYGLEVRVPFLDPLITDFAFNLHRDLKLRNGELKYFLKQVLFDYLPAELFNRPKWGFSIPLKKWLKTDLYYLLEKYTAESVIEKHALLENQKVKSLLKRYLAGEDYLFNRLWAIVVLHWWLEEHSGIKKQALETSLLTFK